MKKLAFALLLFCFVPPAQAQDGGFTEPGAYLWDTGIDSDAQLRNVEAAIEQTMAG